VSSHPAGDTPFSVGELLVDADRTARQLLGRPADADGTSLLAGWDAVLDAASQFLTANTARTARTAHTDATGPTEGADAADRMAGPGTGLVTQLAEEARVVGVAQVPSRVHPDIIRVTHAWQQAAAVHRQEVRRQSVPPESPESPESAEQVALRTVRTLATVAHATQLALGGHGPGVAGLDRDEVDGFRRLLQRHEQLALRSLHALTAGDPRDAALKAGDRSAPDAGRAAPDRSPVDRLAGRLKRWGPLAIVAAADPTTSVRDLRRIAQMEVITTAAAAALVAAAGQRRDLPPEAVPHLQRRLEAVSQQWQEVASQWAWIRRFGALDPSPEVQRSSQALAVAVTDVNHEIRIGRPGASPDPARPAADDLIPVLRNVAENSAILAEIYRRLPTRTHRHDGAGRLRPVLFAPDRILQQIARETYARDHAQFRPGAQVSTAALDLPVASRRGDELRAVTPAAAAFLRAAGTVLAGAATAAEQALELAAGDAGPRWPAHRPYAAAALIQPAPTRPAPAPPHMPAHPNPGTPPDTGISR